jgi:hypothetical protein
MVAQCERKAHAIGGYFEPKTGTPAAADSLAARLTSSRRFVENWRR